MISETQFRRDLNEKFSLTGLVHDLSEYGIQFLYEAIRLYKDTNKMNRKQMVKSLQEIANVRIQTTYFQKPLTESQQVELFDWFEDYCIQQIRKFKQQKNKSLFIKSIQAIKNDQARELNENQNRQLSQPINKKVKVNDNKNNEKPYTQSDHEEDPEPISQENNSNQNQTDQLMLLLLLTAVNQQQKTTESQSQVKVQNLSLNLISRTINSSMKDAGTFPIVPISIVNMFILQLKYQIQKFHIVQIFSALQKGISMHLYASAMQAWNSLQKPLMQL
ncbi:unnamed protein product (macronuclear) [Paramecium tetraurelia]|uniref:Uncharacterized protein n=1 Tax=Paramecium tetraurelia TaxID=5888 RepID=A0E025_PARTE|nr:uncharacterized protein GSPATT00021810001 [Paramecium tetraurelia]CAK88642.1 unnamed protein product [Paramecium tetraurelia]|eukprot:XP_001456039.1 hypothetical protein (macronuclear) [Paramecium tetraurelia strain d4-2]